VCLIHCDRHVVIRLILQVFQLTLYVLQWHDVVFYCVAVYDVCDCCSPLHVAVVQEDLSLVQQILQTVFKLSAPVDCYNNLRQVCTLSLHQHHCHHLSFSTSYHWEHGNLHWVITSTTAGGRYYSDHCLFFSFIAQSFGQIFLKFGKYVDYGQRRVD